MSRRSSWLPAAVGAVTAVGVFLAAAALAVFWSAQIGMGPELDPDFELGPLGPDRSVAQSLRAQADDLVGLQIAARAVGTTQPLRVRAELLVDGALAADRTFEVFPSQRLQLRAVSFDRPAPRGPLAVRLRVVEGQEGGALYGATRLNPRADGALLLDGQVTFPEREDLSLRTLHWRTPWVHLHAIADDARTARVFAVLTAALGAAALGLAAAAAAACAVPRRPPAAVGQNPNNAPARAWHTHEERPSRSTRTRPPMLPATALRIVPRLGRGRRPGAVPGRHSRLFRSLRPRGHRRGRGQPRRLLAEARRALAGAVLALLAVGLLLACAPGQAEGTLADARERAQAGDADGAMDILRGMAARGERDAAAFQLLGVLHASRGELPEAIGALTHALSLSPQDLESLILRGTAYFDVDDPAHALVDFDRAVELDPRAHDAYLLRGEAHAVLGQAQAAIADADVVIGRAEDGELLGRALWLRATMHFALGTVDAGLADLDRYSTLQPGDAEPHAMRGRALASVGRFDEALAALRQALDTAPDNPLPLLDIAGVLLAQDRIDEARRVIDEASERIPDQPRLRLMRGEFAALAGDAAGARAELEAAISMSGPGSPIATRAQVLLARLTGA